MMININELNDFLNSEYQVFCHSASEVYPRTFTIDEKDDIKKVCLEIFHIYGRKCMSLLDLRKHMCHLFETKYGQQVAKEHPLFKYEDAFVKELSEEVKYSSLICGASSKQIAKRIKPNDLTKFLDKFNKNVAACSLMFLIRTMDLRPFTPIKFDDDQWVTPVFGATSFPAAVPHKRDKRIIKDLTTNKIYDNEGLILCSPEKDYTGWELTFHRTEIPNGTKLHYRSFNIRYFEDSTYTNSLGDNGPAWLMVKSIEKRVLATYHANNDGMLPLREIFKRVHLELSLSIAKFHLTKALPDGKRAWLDLETVSHAINSDFADLKEDSEVVYRYLHRNALADENESDIKELEKIFVFCDLGAPMDHYIVGKLVSFIIWYTQGFEVLDFFQGGVRSFNILNDQVGNCLNISKVSTDCIRKPSDEFMESIKDAHFFTVTPNFAVDGNLPKEIQLTIDPTTKEVKYLPWNE